MQTKELVRIGAPAADPDRRRRSRRSRAVAALVAVLAAATLGAVAAAGSRGDDAPSERPVPTWHVVPTQPSDLPYYGSTVDG